jgi:hypothetical protein
VRSLGVPPRQRKWSWRRIAAASLLLAPVLALSWVPWYAQDRPRLAGVPFFYWYQLAWIPSCALADRPARYMIPAPQVVPPDRPSERKKPRAIPSSRLTTSRLHQPHGMGRRTPDSILRLRLRTEL